MTRTELNSAALQIKNAVIEGENTADRVGGFLENLLASVRLESERSYASESFDGSQLQDVTNSDPFKMTIPATTSLVTPKNFTVDPNRFTKEGNGNPLFVTATLVVTGATNDRLAFYFAKNGEIIDSSKGIVRIAAPGGGDLRQVVIQDLIEMNADDYLEVWAQNETDSSDFTLLFANFILSN